MYIHTYVYVHVYVSSYVQIHTYTQHMYILSIYTVCVCINIHTYAVADLGFVKGWFQHQARGKNLGDQADFQCKNMPICIVLESPI